MATKNSSRRLGRARGAAVTKKQGLGVSSCGTGKGFPVTTKAESAPQG